MVGKNVVLAYRSYVGEYSLGGWVHGCVGWLVKKTGRQAMLSMKVTCGIILHYLKIHVNMEDLYGTPLQRFAVRNALPYILGLFLLPVWLFL